MTRLKLIAASLAATALVAIPAANADEQTKGEIKLAKMLEGRVAGEPQSCIRSFPQAHLTVIDKTALVYKVGRTLYVNIPDNARSLDDTDTMVRRTYDGTRLCNTDIIRTVDMTGGFYTGNVLLGDFVPYRKPAQTDG